MEELVLGSLAIVSVEEEDNPELEDSISRIRPSRRNNPCLWNNSRPHPEVYLLPARTTQMIPSPHPRISLMTPKPASKLVELPPVVPPFLLHRALDRYTLLAAP